MRFTEQCGPKKNQENECEGEQKIRTVENEIEFFQLDHKLMNTS